MKNELSDNQKVNMIAIYFDLIQQYLIELNPNLRHGMKKWCNSSITHINKFIKECDNIFNKENQINFGDESDKIRVLIEKHILK